MENLTPATIAKAWYRTSFVLQLIVFLCFIVKKEKVTFLFLLKGQRYVVRIFYLFFLFI